MTSSFSPKKLLPLAFAALASAAALTGCGSMSTTAATTNLSSAATVSGKIHGGNQPVSGATVTLFQVGSSGYGTGAVQLAQVTSSNDGTGSFSFNQHATGSFVNTSPDYVCPATGSSQLYILANGGVTQGATSTANSNAAFIAAIGDCTASASLFVDLNEVTTVATMAALQQYFNPTTEAFGYNGTGTQSETGFLNGVATIANLANISTGVADTSTSSSITSGTNMGAVSVTITPETGKVNTIANILASCVNNSGSNAANCQTLFTNAAPPAASTTSQPSNTLSTATDTVQAAYYMMTNPTNNSSGTSNIANVYALEAGAGAPFQPTTGAQPTDWTIGVTYLSASKCTANNPFITYAYQISVDSTGNVWMANGASAGGASKMSPVGKPLNCSDITYAGPRGGAVIDTNGNVWTTSNTSNSIYKYDGSTTTTIPLTGHSYGIAADGNGNVFFTDGSSKLYELPSTATATTTPTLIGSVNGSSPFTVAIDGHETVVVGQSSTSTSGSPNSVIAFPTTVVGGTAYPSTGTTVTQTSYYEGVYGLAFDASNRFWVATSSGSTGTTTANNTTSATLISYSDSTLGDSQAATVSFTPDSTTLTGTGAGGLTTGRWAEVDGAGNVWIANNGTGGGVSEFTKTGAALSPSTGYTKASTVFTSLRGLAIDPTGNVWVSNTNSPTTTDWITEMVGAAVPIITPISAQVSTNKFATKP